MGIFNFTIEENFFLSEVAISALSLFIYDPVCFSEMVIEETVKNKNNVVGTALKEMLVDCLTLNQILDTENIIVKNTITPIYLRVEII